MSLTPELRKQLREAIQTAYTSYDDLRIAIGEGTWQGLTNVRLEQFVKPDPLRLVVFNLVEWAENHGRVEDLYEVCVEGSPGNAELGQLAEPIRALDEERKPIEEIADEITLKEATYTLPTPTTQQERLITGNLVVATVILLLAAAWTVIFIDGAWIVWLTFFGPTLGSSIWDMIGNQLLAVRVISFFRGVLISRATLIALTIVFVVVGGLSLGISQVKYVGQPTDAAITVAGVELSPGDVQWLLVPATGKKFRIERVGAGYRDGEIMAYPWQRTKIRPKIMPYIVIEPAAQVIGNISTSDTSPNRQWKLTVTMGNQVIYRNSAYKGMPVKIGPDPNHWPDPTGFTPKRAPTIKHVVNIKSGDELHIELSRGMTTHVADVTVGDPASLAAAAELVEIPQ